MNGITYRYMYVLSLHAKTRICKADNTILIERLFGSLVMNYENIQR